jgi:hypothetical protein
MFVRPKRRGWVVPVVAVALAGAVVAGAVLLTRHPVVVVHGTFTMFEPLACTEQSRSHLEDSEIVFLDLADHELARTTASSGIELHTERVRGFAHCRMAGTYRIRVRRVSTYVVELAATGERRAPITYQQLAATAFRYDIVD